MSFVPLSSAPCRPSSPASNIFTRCHRVIELHCSVLSRVITPVGRRELWPMTGSKGFGTICLYFFGFLGLNIRAIWLNWWIFYREPTNYGHWQDGNNWNSFVCLVFFICVNCGEFSINFFFFREQTHTMCYSCSINYSYIISIYKVSHWSLAKGTVFLKANSSTLKSLWKVHIFIRQRNF